MRSEHGNIQYLSNTIFVMHENLMAQTVTLQKVIITILL